MLVIIRNYEKIQNNHRYNRYMYRNNNDNDNSISYYFGIIFLTIII